MNELNKEKTKEKNVKIFLGTFKDTRKWLYANLLMKSCDSLVKNQKHG